MPRYRPNTWYTDEWKARADELFEEAEQIEPCAANSQLHRLIVEAAKLLQSLVDQQGGVIMQVHKAPFVETKIMEHPVSVEHTDTSHCGLREVDGFYDQESRGWEIVEIRETQRPTTKQVTDSATGYLRDEHQVLTVPVYVLGKRRDRAMIDLRGQVRRYGNALCEAKSKEHKATEALKELEGSIDKANNTEHSLREKLTKSDEYLTKREETIRKLEEGLAEKDKEIARLKEKLCS